MGAGEVLPWEEGRAIGAFDDLYSANEGYAAAFTDPGLTGRARRGLAVLTCIDSRIDPLAALGLAPGDAKIIRNAGARVSTETLTTLVLAVYLLGVDRIFLMPHTDCGVTKTGDADIHARAAERGIDVRSLEFPLIADQDAVLARDLLRIRTSPFLPEGVAVDGALFDVTTGGLTRVMA
jgi:carbonic anhydrase